MNKPQISKSFLLAISLFFFFIFIVQPENVYAQCPDPATFCVMNYPGCPANECPNCDLSHCNCFDVGGINRCDCWTCCGSGLCVSSNFCELGTECCGECAGAGGCFTEETSIDTKSQDTEIQGEKEIKDLKEGEIVSSFNPETGEVKGGTVSEVSKLTREGYYELETESGKKVKVTGEHPFLAVKAKNNQAPNDKSQTISKFQNSISKLENILSHTLTYQLITGLGSKLSNVLK